MRTFITIAIALCLTAPLLAAENTCVSPCVKCSSPSAENFECEVCWGQELKAAVSPATLKACGTATLSANCQVPDAADVTKCSMCKTGFTLNPTAKTCFANATIDKCMKWGTKTGADTTSVCLVCKGLFAPTVADSLLCDVTATAITSCAGYSAADTCGACDAEFIFQSNDNTCVAVSDTNRGCASLDAGVCQWCDATASYYATSFVAATGSVCSKSSTFMMIKIALALVIASLF